MIHREDQDSVAVLRMEHGKVNAVDSDLFDQLEEALDEVLAAEPRPRAVVLTGTGSSFSAGVNLFKVVEGSRSYLEQFLPKLSGALKRLLGYPLPVVAAINGHAIAGGCVLACACDRRVMADGRGRIGLTELLVGVPFPAAALETVRDLVPSRHVQDVVYRGRALFPGEALEMSMVDEVVPPEEVLPRAVEAARAFGDIPSDTFALSKRQLRADLLERIDRRSAEVDADVLEIWARPETAATIRGFLERTVGRK